MISVYLIISGCSIGGWYEKGIARLQESLRDRTNAEFKKYFFKTSHPERHPSNYSIKGDALLMASNECQYVLWLDASMWAVKNIDPIFKIIRERGYFILDNPGWSTGQWTSDKCLKFFGTSRDTAMQLPHCMSGVIGLDTTKYKEFILQFKKLGEMGLMNGDWTNDRKQVSQDDRVLGHRHDQSVLSLMLLKNEMTQWEDPGKWISFPKPGDPPPPEPVYLCAQGL